MGWSRKAKRRARKYRGFTYYGWSDKYYIVKEVGRQKVYEGAKAYKIFKWSEHNYKLYIRYR